MATWNHRVVRYKEGSFGIHECYYYEDGSISGITENPVAPYGETLAELEFELSVSMKRALYLPPINMETLKEVQDA